MSFSKQSELFIATTKTIPKAPSLETQKPSGVVMLNQRAYRLGRTVGEGNHARIFRVVKRPLVAKINGNDIDELAIREGEILESMKGPGVVRCFDHGTLGDGRTALILEYVKGVPFSDLVGKVGPSQALVILRAMARTLEEVHAEGVIHRDFKPGNVLIDSEGRAKVLDFGLAARIGRHDHFFDQKASGTPRYMAPEQFIPGAENVTFGLDVYALGVTITQALTGMLPFSTTNPNKMLYDKMSGTTSANPAELIATSKRTARIRCRHVIAEIVAEMLRVFPEDRPLMDKVNRELNRNP